jgi:Na+/melibiose symporter-like transporter
MQLWSRIRPFLSPSSFFSLLHRRYAIGASPRETRLIFAYGLAAFPVALVNNVWVTYNYAHFVGGILADSYLFILVQAIFLVWNSVNDPLFGWLSDHTDIGAIVGQSKAHPCLRRIQHIRYAGYLLGAAFLFAWFPWSDTSRPLAALHFLLSLSFYDGALTYMEVNHASLLADLSSNTQTRAWCNSASSLFSILGSFSSFFAHVLYAEKSNGRPDSTSSATEATVDGPSFAFRIFCLATVALALPAVELSVRVIGDWARTHVAIPSTNVEIRNLAGASQQSSPDASPIAVSDSPTVRSPSVRIASVQVGAADSLLEHPNGAHPPTASHDDFHAKPAGDAHSPHLTFQLFVRQLLSHRNFSLFCGLRLLQVFLCTFEKNHLSSFLDILLSDYLSTSTRGMLISMSFILPHLLLLVTSAYQQELGGVYAIIRQLFTSKIVCALGMLAALLLGTSGGLSSFSSSTSMLPFLLTVYLCGSRVFTECVCRLFPLVVSNLVDEDRVLHLRPSSMAATLIGTSSLLAKPGESLAPMLGWQVLNAVAVDAQEDSDEDGLASEAAISAHTFARKQALLYLLLLLPLVTVSLQLLLWHFFTLRGTYLKRISQRVLELEGAPDSHHQLASLASPIDVEESMQK